MNFSMEEEHDWGPHLLEVPIDSRVSRANNWLLNTSCGLGMVPVVCFVREFVGFDNVEKNLSSRLCPVLFLSFTPDQEGYLRSGSLGR